MLERGMDEGNREAGHSDECRVRMEAKIREFIAQRQRLESANRRRDEYLAREVDRGVGPEVAQEKQSESTKRKFSWGEETCGGRRSRGGC